MLSKTTDDRLIANNLTFVLADEHALVRECLKHLIWQKRPDVRFVEFSNAIALMNAAEIAPGASLALIDTDMPGMAQGHALSHVATSLPDIPIVIISAMEDSAFVQNVLSVPAVHSFVAKNSTAEHLHMAIDAALCGDRQSRPVPRRPRLRPRPRPREVFTPRMTEIHALLCHGMSNRAIAAALSLSEGTIKNYTSEIFRALGVVNRTQAAGCEALSANVTL